MSTDVLHHGLHHHVSSDEGDRPAALGYLAPVGRALFAAIFLTSSIGHFSQGMIQHAASQGVPFAHIAVPLSGVVALLGGLSVLLGFRTRYGAALIALFLVPVTLTMHAFWNVSDPAMHQMQQISFMKNLSILGGALTLLYAGGGPFSLDAHFGHGDDEAT